MNKPTPGNTPPQNPSQNSGLPPAPGIPVLTPEEMARLRLQSGNHDHEEAVKNWLKKNVSTLLTATVLGLLALFGWQWWQAQKLQQAQLQAEQYSKFLQAESQGNQVVADTLAKNLRREKSVYATLVVLQQAQRAAKNTDYAQAETLLVPLADDAKNPLQNLAKLRLAAVLTAQGKNDAALTQLAALPPEELPLLAEWRGDLLALQGEKEAARNAYVLALAQNGDSERITYKISALASATTPAVETPAVETPAVETPAVETPAVETPAVETPIVETPIVENPVAEETAREKSEKSEKPALVLP